MLKVERSESRLFTMGGAPVELKCPLPGRLPNGKFPVLRRVVLRIVGTITVATLAWDGRDVAGLVGLVSVEDVNARQMLPPITGRQQRLDHHLRSGPASYPEHGTVAIGAAQAIDLRLPLLSPPARAGAPDDYWIPAGLVRRVLVQPATLVAAATGTTVLSADSLQVVAEWWWDEASQLIYPAQEETRVYPFTSTAQAMVPLSDRLRCLSLISSSVSAAAVAGGGGSIVAVTSVQVDPLGIPPMLRSTALDLYRWAYGQSNAGSSAVAAEVWGSPVTEGRIWPVVMPHEGKPWDGIRAGDAVKVDITPTASIEAMVTCSIPRGREHLEGLLAAVGMSRELARSAQLRTARAGERSLSADELSRAPLVLARA